MKTKLFPRAIGAALVALAAAAGTASGDWTQTYIAADPLARNVTRTGINALGEVASNANIRFERFSSPSFLALLGDVPGSDPVTSTAVGLVEGPNLRNVTTGVLVNPDLRVSAGRIGSITRFETVGSTGYASAIDYGSGDLILARLNIPAAQFSLVANQPIAGFANNRTYFIKTVADGTNITVKAYDAALGLTDGALVATTGNGGIINPANDLVGGTGLFVRADGQATPAIATFGRLYAETLLRETQYAGTGEDDLFWLNNDGSLWVWALNDTVLESASYVTTLPTGLKIPTTADFNDDGVADLVCFNATTGQTGVIVSNTSGPSAWASLPTLAANTWDLVGSGDLSSDGVPDLVYFNRTTRALWLRRIGRNSSDVGIGALPVVRASTAFFTVPSGWRVQAVHDIDRDGEQDIIFRNDDGANGVVLMDDTEVRAWLPLPFVDSDWNIVGLSDLNDDGQSDLLWRDGTGTMVGWIMDQSSLVTTVDFPSLGAGWTPSN